MPLQGTHNRVSFILPNNPPKITQEIPSRNHFTLSRKLLEIDKDLSQTNAESLISSIFMNLSKIQAPLLSDNRKLSIKFRDLEDSLRKEEELNEINETSLEQELHFLTQNLRGIDLQGSSYATPLQIAPVIYPNIPKDQLIILNEIKETLLEVKEIFTEENTKLKMKIRLIEKIIIEKRNYFDLVREAKRKIINLTQRLQKIKMRPASLRLFNESITNSDKPPPPSYLSQIPRPPRIRPQTSRPTKPDFKEFSS